MPHDQPWSRHERDRWLRHDAHRWIRHDVERFLAPGIDPADVYPALARQREAEDAAFAAEIAKARRGLAALREEVASIRAEMAQRRLAATKYSPYQPRIPKRNPGGGQFTRIGGNGQSPSTGIAQPMGDVAIGDATGSDDTSGLLHITITPDSSDSEGVQLAGDPPDDSDNTPLDDPAPKIPRRMPEVSGERMRFVRDAAGWVGRQLRRYAPAVDTYFRALDQVEQIKALTAAIKSANDPARTLEELQRPVGSPSQAGYHDHHIAEESAARDANDPESRIQGRDNLVRIPVLKHIEITSYYSTKVKQEDGTKISPRDELKGKDFETRRQFGLDILRKRGVLK